INSLQQNPKSALASSVVSSQANIVTSQADKSAVKFSEKQNSEQQDLKKQYSKKPGQSEQDINSRPLGLDAIILSLNSETTVRKASQENSANNSSLTRESNVDNRSNPSPQSLGLNEIKLILQAGGNKRKVYQTSTAQSSLPKGPASPIKPKSKER
ncbi:MAG: hypothetical protein ACKO47_05790, partial [Alphaproteobacteria bacterium]